MPEIRVCKHSTCPSLRKYSTLTYDIGVAADNRVYIRVTDNSNFKVRTRAGLFSEEWCSVEDLLNFIEKEKERFAGTILKPVLKTRNRNTSGFLLAVLREEGFVKGVPNKNNSNSNYNMFHRRTEKSIDDLMKELHCIQ